MDKEQNEEITSSAIDNILPTSNEDEMKNLMKNLDREQAYREHKCWRQYITVIVSIIFVAFQLYATLSGAVTAQILRATHLAFVQFLAFLLFPATKKLPRDTLPLYDVILGLVGAGCWMYIVINFQQLVRRSGNNTVIDVIIGITLTIKLYLNFHIGLIYSLAEISIIINPDTSKTPPITAKIGELTEKSTFFPAKSNKSLFLSTL